MSGERCSGCLGKTMHHTCGKEPDADTSILRAELSAMRQENARLKDVQTCDRACLFGIYKENARMREALRDAEVEIEAWSALDHVDSWSLPSIKRALSGTAPSTHRLVPVERLLLAFVDGAKWWEYRETGATMWQSDQRGAYLVAEERLAAGTLAVLGEALREEKA